MLNKSILISNFFICILIYLFRAVFEQNKAFWLKGLNSMLYIRENIRSEHHFVWLAWL